MKIDYTGRQVAETLQNYLAESIVVSNGPITLITDFPANLAESPAISSVSSGEIDKEGGFSIETDDGRKFRVQVSEIR